ncbi:hypothetical protein BD410DRAFT_284008 [Rickenella mellea]|uniref:Zn(2)-C6 fungal-type domain-containing protein n=1 Tax=Rickenella mellea TaxID=50990 RepID=A0A4Y7Q3K1_9AGAM|nr:hypothetical protein BD410DRAFT_284008 [Rickenella mellea]
MIPSDPSPTDPEQQEQPRRPPKRSASSSPVIPSRTSLPSIHELHPFLPPTQQHTAASPTYPLPLPSPPGYGASPSGSAPQSRAVERKYAELYSGTTPGHDYEGAGGPESDPELEGQHDQSGPPKKKRRRQALSCTECKRRKIRCDRSQPCGPCLRRGDQAKCQWHVVEPIEKYVSRPEWDDLNLRYTRLEARYARLEAFIIRLHPDFPGGGGSVSPVLQPTAGTSRVVNLLSGPGVAGFTQQLSPSNPAAELQSRSSPTTSPRTHSAHSGQSGQSQSNPSPPLPQASSSYHGSGAGPSSWAPARPGMSAAMYPHLPPVPDSLSIQPRSSSSQRKHRLSSAHRTQPQPGDTQQQHQQHSSSSRSSPLTLSSIIGTESDPREPQPQPSSQQQQQQYTSPTSPRAKNWEAQTPIVVPGGRLRHTVRRAQANPQSPSQCLPPPSRHCHAPPPRRTTVTVLTLSSTTNSNSVAMVDPPPSILLDS